MRVLARSDIRALVSMSDAVDAMKTAFAALSAGEAESPLRTVLHLAEQRTDALTMPAVIPGAGALGVKLVSVSANNPSRGLPLIHAVVLMVDPDTGVPEAILDGSSITALRTGAVSGAATDLLSRANSRTLVIYGAGVQAVTQAAAVCTVRSIERIIIVGRREDGFGRFMDMIDADYPELADRIETTTDATACQDADVICAATTSKTPVFSDRDIRPGTHINGVGAYTPEMQEIPSATVGRAVIVVDAIDAVLAEAGDLVIPIREGLVSRESIHRELGQLVSGKATGRQSPEDITFFKSVGNAVQDVMVARLAIDRALETGRGQTITIT